MTVQVDRNTNQHPLRPQGVGIFTDYADTMEKLYVAARRRSLKLTPSAGAGPEHEKAAEQGSDAGGRWRVSAWAHRPRWARDAMLFAARHKGEAMPFDRSTDQPRSRSVGVFADYALKMNRLYVAGRRRALRLKQRVGAGQDREQAAEQRWDAEGGGLKQE